MSEYVRIQPKYMLPCLLWFSLRERSRIQQRRARDQSVLVGEYACAELAPVRLKFELKVIPRGKNFLSESQGDTIFFFHSNGNQILVTILQFFLHHSKEEDSLSIALLTTSLQNTIFVLFGEFLTILKHRCSFFY